MQSVTGWAIAVHGVVNVRTVSPTAFSAKVNGLTILSGFMPMNVMSDGLIETAWETWSARNPGHELVRVTIVPDV